MNTIRQLKDRMVPGSTERLRPLTRNTELDKYLHRNMVVCKAIGVRAGLQHAIIRLGQQRRAPKWLLNLLLSERIKMDAVVNETVVHREEVVG